MFYRITLLFSLVLLLNLDLNAQKRVFNAGLLGGFTTSHVMRDGLAHFSRMGFYGGGFISTKFGDHWSGEIGMTYVMKGSKERFFNNASFNGYIMTLGYLEFPFLAKYRLGDWDFEGGLTLGLLLHSKEENIIQDEAFSSAKFEEFEFGGMVGVNYFFTEKIAGNIRLSGSILPIRYPTDNVYRPPLYGQRNIVLSFAVRYFIQ